MHRALMVAVVGLAAVSCASDAPRAGAGPATSRVGPARAADATPVQAAVMDLADEYNAALSEAVYLVVRSSGVDPRGRWLAQSFLRNGMGAALDIAVQPNPGVALLDLLVLTRLQAWAFRKHWIPAGIGEAGLGAADRLDQAERATWAAAARVLSAPQITELAALTDAWIAAHPERTVVSLVRFDDFVDARLVSSDDRRRRASGLLREVGEATAVIDQTRLLGERVLWFASRYPYLLGQQTELTTYRLIDQPEVREVLDTVSAVRARLESLDADLTAQRAGLFESVAAERELAIARVREEFEGVLGRALADVQARFEAEREASLDRFFEAVAAERAALLDDLTDRDAQLRGIMGDVRETITASGGAARDIQGTVEAVDRVVSRFDRDPDDTSEPLRISEVRDAAIETGRAADRLTVLLERTDTLLESDTLERQIQRLESVTNAAVDRAFWRGLALVLVLVTGLGVIRLIPGRGGGGSQRA